MYKAPNRKNTLLLSAIGISLILAILASVSNQQAQALSAITFSSQATFTSLNSNNKWAKVWTNVAGTSTYFLDSSGANWKSVKMNNTSGATQATITGALVGGGTTLTSLTGSSTDNDKIFLQSQGGSDQNLNNGGTTIIAEKVATASSLLVGKVINEVHVWLKWITTVPTAGSTIRIAVMNNVGTESCSFGTKDANTLTNAYVEYTFTSNTCTRTLASGDYIGVFFNSGDATHIVGVEYVNSDQYDGATNTIAATCTGAQGAATCSDQTARELHLQIGYDHVAANANQNQAGILNWENAGFTVQGVQNDFTTSTALQGGTVGGNIIAAEKKTTSSTLAGKTTDQIDLTLSKTGSPTGTITVGEVQTVVTNKALVNTGTTITYSLDGTNIIDAEKITATGALVGQQVNSVSFSMTKTSSPSGTITAGVFDGSGNLLYTFGTMNPASLTGSVATYTFTNYASSYTVPNSVVYIGIKCPNGTCTAVNKVNLGDDSNNQYDGTNSVHAIFTASWTANTGEDLGSSSAGAYTWRVDLFNLTPTNTYGTLSAASLTTSPAVYTFTSGSSFTLSNSATTYVSVIFTGGDSSNTVNVHRTAADAFDGTTNSIFSAFTGVAFADTTTADMAFRITLTATNNVETGAFLKWNAGSAQNTGGVKVYWTDNTKIPSSVKLSTSTDDISYTDRVTLSPTQATGFNWLALDQTYSVQYVKMTVVTWGTAKSMQIGEFQRLPTGLLGSAFSAIESNGGTQTAYYVSRTSATSLHIGIINLDTGAVTNSMTQTVTTDGLANADSALSIVASPNKIYAVYLTNEGGSMKVREVSANRDLSSPSESAVLLTLAASAAGSQAYLTCVLATDGASAATDLVYCEIASNTQSTATFYLMKILNAAGTQLTSVTGAASNLEMTNVSDKVIYRYTISGTENTATITKSSDALSGVLYTKTWVTYTRQPFDFDGTTRTYKSTTGTGLYSAYYASTAYAIAYAANTGTLTDPFRLYAETVSGGTITGIASTFYRISDGLVVTGSGTTWTPKTFSATDITPTPKTERLLIPLATNNTLRTTGVIKFLCDTTYTYTGYSELFVGSDADCLYWRIVASSSDTIGRTLAYARTGTVVHANPLTSYTISLSVANPDIYTLQTLYQGQQVDGGAFDSGGSLGQYLLYGNCYTMQVVESTSGNTVQTGTLCANDITTKTISLSGITVPDDWLKHTWSYSITRTTTNPDNNGLLFAIEKSVHPYNASIHVTNNLVPSQASGSIAYYSQWFNFTNRVAISVANVTGRASNETLYFNVYENGDKVLNAVSNGDPNFGDLFSESDFGLLFGLPVAFVFPMLTAAIFPKSLAYFGAIVTVAVIGLMTVFHFITLPVWYWAVIMPVLAFAVFVGYKRQ